MRALVMVVSLSFVSFFGLAVTSLHADGECAQGYRDITAQERAAMTTVLQGALRTIAPPPEGWVLDGDDDLYLDPKVCRDYEAQPWTYDFSRRYLRVDDRAQREESLAAAGTEYQAAMQAKQPRLDAIMARIQELAASAVAAGQKGDLDRVDAINVQIEQASAEYERVMAEGGTLDQLDAANEDAARDQSIRIAIAVNTGSESLGYEAQKTTGPIGAKHAYRWNDTSYSDSDETRLVLFGSWQPNGDRFDQVVRANAAPTSPQGISVRVTADASRIDSVLASIDFEALAALVAR